ncbi:MAG: hypothetical protein AB8G14_04910 [Ilumatobacter sp.]
MTHQQAPIIPGDPNARQLSSGWWIDDYGVVGPYKPGHGPRSDPREAFPTGPAVGSPFPNIVAMDQSGTMIDVHEARESGPAIVVFSRATLW